MPRHGKELQVLRGNGNGPATSKKPEGGGFSLQGKKSGLEVVWGKPSHVIGGINRHNAGQAEEKNVQYTVANRFREGHA